MALASAEIAIPTSPIPPERASGTILKNGNAVIMVFGIQFPSGPITHPLPGS